MAIKLCPQCNAELTAQDTLSADAALETHLKLAHGPRAVPAAPEETVPAKDHAYLLHSYLELQKRVEEHPLLHATRKAFPDQPETHAKVVEILKGA